MTYSSKLLAEIYNQEVGNWTIGPKRPPGWVLDLIADEKLNGGYKSRRNPICPTCRVRRSNSGNCTCTDS